MAINFLTTTNTLPEIQINDTGNNPRLKLQESGSVSGGISTTGGALVFEVSSGCLLYTSPSPRDATLSRMPSSA